MYVKLLALFVAMIAVGTTEFVISGILPAIAADLAVPIPTAGLLVTGYAIGVAIGGPALALLTRRLARKTALLGLLGLFIAAHLLCALAPDYTALLVGRIVAAACHGSLQGLCIVIAAGLAPDDRRGSAISVVLTAVPVANILGVPIGTFLGDAFGWRTTFWLVLALAVVGLVAIVVFIDNVRQASSASTLGRQLRALVNEQVLTSYAIIIVMMIGFWSINTFIAPYLTTVGGLPQVWVAGALLLCGIGGTIGTALGGRLANRRAVETMIVVFPLLALVYAAFLWVAPGHGLVAAGLIGAVWLVGSVAITPVQARVVAGAGDAPELASTLIGSVFNVGIATGSWFAATLLTVGVTLPDLPLYSALSCIPTTLIALGAWLWERRRPLAVTPRARA